MTIADSESPLTGEQELEALVRRMQSELAATTDKLTATTAKLASITSERDGLRKAYRQLMEQFELLKRRIFIAKAERVDATQLEREFEKTKKKLDALAQQLGGHAAMADATPDGNQPDAPGSRPSGKPPAKAKTPGKGRKNLADRDDLRQRRIEIRDAALEKGGGTFIGWELSYNSATSDQKRCACRPSRPRALPLETHRTGRARLYDDTANPSRSSQLGLFEEH